jgi:ankyrin repeat protein
MLSVPMNHSSFGRMQDGHSLSADAKANHDAGVLVGAMAPSEQPVFPASAASQVNASNNAGDTPWHWASNMGWGEVAGLLERNGASKQKGGVLVPEHVPKVKVRPS